MYLAYVETISTGTLIRWGFKSKTQLPLFMLWREEWHKGEVIWASVIWQSTYLKPSYWS